MLPISRGTMLGFFAVLYGLKWDLLCNPFVLPCLVSIQIEQAGRKSLKYKLNTGDLYSGKTYLKKPAPHIVKNPTR